MKTIIIGGVAAGMSCASKLRRLDPNHTIHVYEKGQDLSYGGCGMPYYLGNIIPDIRQLIARTKDDFEKQNIQVFLSSEVIEVVPEKKEIIIKDLTTNHTFIDNYDHLVIATGTSANRTQVEGSNQSKIYVLNSLEDARSIKQNINGVKEVAIIGGGYIGLEIAENLNALGIKVHIIERSNQLLIVYDTKIAEEAKKILQKNNISIYLDEQLESYQPHHHQTIITTNKRSLTVDMVIESIGVRPNTSFLKNTGIDMLSNGAIITNEYQESSIKDIYAAGDCAAYYHQILKTPVFVPLGTHANKTGRIVAENIAGLKSEFNGIIGSNVIKIEDYAFAKTGIGFDEAKRYGFNYQFVDVIAKNQSGYYPGAEPIHVRMVYDPKTTIIKGCQIYGKKGVTDRINVMAIAIINQMTAADFAQSDLAYAPPFSPVWDPLLVAANQIGKPE